MGTTTDPITVKFIDLFTEEELENKRLLEWNTQLSNSLIPLNALLGLYMISGILGNLLVLYVYSLKMRVSLDDRYFVLALAAVDTIVCVTAPVFSTSRNMLPVVYENDILCKLAWFVTKDMNAISVMLILLIGIQRYLKVCRPFGRQMKKRENRLAFVFIIVLCSLTHGPIFVFYGQTLIVDPVTNTTGYHCGRVHHHMESWSDQMEQFGYIYLILIFVTAIGCLSIIALLYTLIWKGLKKQMHKRYTMKNGTLANRSMSITEESKSMDDSTAEIESSGSIRSKLNSLRKPKRRRLSYRSKHQYTFLFISISGVCFATYVPTLIVNISVNMDDTPFWTEFNPGLRVFCIFLFQFYIINHVANPFIYALFDSKFREEVSKLFACKKATTEITST